MLGKVKTSIRVTRVGGLFVKSEHLICQSLINPICYRFSPNSYLQALEAKNDAMQIGKSHQKYAFGLMMDEAS